MKKYESIKVDAKIVRKVRRYAAKSKQTIGGIFELGAAALLSPSKEIAKWKEKADKWDALGEEVSRLYPIYQMSDAIGLDDISTATVNAFDIE